MTPGFEYKILCNIKQSAHPIRTPFSGKFAPLQAERMISSSTKTKTLAITMAWQRGRALPVHCTHAWRGTRASLESCKLKENNVAKQPNTTMMDGEANHSVTERPRPFQANFHPGVSPLALVQPCTALGGSPAETKPTIPAWRVSICLGCSPAPVPWSGVVGGVQHGHCSAGPGRERSPGSAACSSPVRG